MEIPEPQEIDGEPAEVASAAVANLVVITSVVARHAEGARLQVRNAALSRDPDPDAGTVRAWEQTNEARIADNVTDLAARTFRMAQALERVLERHDDT